MQNINLGVEDPPFLIPMEDVAQAVSENQFVIMGKPLNLRKQSVRAIIASMPRLWGLEGSIRGRIIDKNCFQFVFRSEEMLDLVLKRGPWEFSDRMLVLERWTPSLFPLALEFIPFWIQIRGIPLHCVSPVIVKRIGESLGDILSSNYDPTSLTRVDFVSIHINWNINNPLKFKRNYQFSLGANTMISFLYERLRGFSEDCGSLCHDSGFCNIEEH